MGHLPFLRFPPNCSLHHPPAEFSVSLTSMLSTHAVHSFTQHPPFLSVPFPSTCIPHSPPQPSSFIPILLTLLYSVPMQSISSSPILHFFPIFPPTCILQSPSHPPFFIRNPSYPLLPCSTSSSSIFLHQPLIPVFLLFQLRFTRRWQPRLESHHLLSRLTEIVSLMFTIIQTSG